MGSLIVRSSERLPAGVVLEAIDKMLSEAKSDKALPLHLSMTTSQGSVALNSTYELRLFQLLPVLEELDKSHADALLRDNTQMQDDLQRFPNGMQSLSPALYGKPPGAKDEGASSSMMSVGIGDDPAQAGKLQAQQEVRAELERRQDAVVGTIDVHRPGRHERFGFSCSVDFNTGRVRSAELDSRPMDW